MSKAQLRDDFETKLNIAMENEENSSGYKPSGKAGVNEIQIWEEDNITKMNF